MKTIEERAEEYNKRYFSKIDDTFQTLAKVAYRVGAIEQKAIDEEVRLKKCDDMTEAEYNRETAFVDWYLENGKGMPAYSDAIEWARKDLFNKAFEYANAKYDLDYCENVRDVLNYLKSLTEE